MDSFGNTPSLLTNQPSLPTSGVFAAPQALLGPSSAMSVLWARIQRVAPYFRTALLTGEAGSGHEAVARALHGLSPLANRPFLALRAADAEQRLASNPSPASFHEGMLYLPEPDRLSSSAQSTLLRLLRERGAQAPRLVTFAERGLRSLIGACAFSPDLANSLGALQIEVPPLRERHDDIPHLIHYLLDHLTTSLQLATPSLDPAFLSAASAQPWTGNLDHLYATLRYLLENSTSTLTAADLDAALTALARTSSPPRPPEARLVRLDQVIREQVQAVLLACNGNKLRAAEILGISRSTLYRMLDSIPQSNSTHART
jgi:DNA-binding NtrC family response regulator